MIQPKIFYFYRLNFLLYFLCKHYFMVFYIPKRLSVIFFLLKISCCIFKLFKKNRNLILNYRFGYRTKSVVNNAPLIKNIDVVKKFSLFKIRLLHSNNSTDVVLAGGGFFFNFYYYKFRYYSSVCSTLILEFMPKIKHLFKIQNYFFTKRKKRFNYFLYI